MLFDEFYRREQVFMVEDPLTTGFGGDEWSERISNTLALSQILRTIPLSFLMCFPSQGSTEQ